MADRQPHELDFGLEHPFLEADESEERDALLALESPVLSPFAEDASPTAGETGEHSAGAGIAEFVAGPTLRLGQSGAGVAALQQALIQLGHKVTADGRFSPGTVSALKEFQSQAGLPADGIAGPRTKAAIAAKLGTAPSTQPVGPVTVTASGRSVVQAYQPLRSHRGTSPDLILRWNRITGSGPVDVVLHFHGYSGHRGAMRIDRHKEAHSGLDFADPKLGTAGRSQPTIGILPRGNYFGGQSGAGYNFPALVRPGAVRQLVQEALRRVSRETGHELTQGRLVITGHSGGGAPLAAVLADADPDEIQIFDGTYGSGDLIAAWARRRIAREVSSPSDSPPAMRILFRPGTQTQAQAKAIWQKVCAALHDASAARLRGRFRVEATPVGHNDIPSRFGWRLLADLAADLPDATPLSCPHRTQRQEHLMSEDLEASPHWHDPANESEQSSMEQLSMEQLSMDTPARWEGEEDFSSDEQYIFSQDEQGLAWLDLEAEEASQEHEGFEPPEGEGPTAEYFEPADEDAGFEAAAMEQLIDAESPGAGFVDRIKGVAAFVLGPTLRLGSAGPAVQTLQRCLTQLGHAVTIDGNFDGRTEQAVRAFQSGAGLTSDGVCGPRTKAAIAAAVGAQAVPQPGPSPTPFPTPASSLADEIVRVAKTELGRWHDGKKLRETDSEAVPVLQRYYREGVKMNLSAAELQDKKWQQAHPWSAVFISYVMRTAGAGSAFRYSPAHQDYIAAARRNRLDNVTSNPFWAYRADEVVPQVGDLVCNARGNSGATYDNIGDKQRRKTHCDIVVAVSPGKLRVIGGNVHDNVDDKVLDTLADGRISVAGKQAAIFAILRCRGPIGSLPGPPAPTEPTAAKKLAPRQFVERFGPSANASEAKHGVPSLVTLGQAALESAWGAHAPRFNFFGIKAKASDPEATRQLLKTKEVLPRPDAKFPEVISVTPRPDGRFNYVVRDWFRAYPDAETAFDAHGAFLVRNKRYARAFSRRNDPYGFATEVARAGYATDPSYESVLHRVMRMLEKVREGAFEAA
jgi:peptidoglycan hydrolase-like protein with peptidoglycan-binding domain